MEEHFDRFKPGGSEPIKVSEEIASMLASLGQAIARIWASMKASGEVNDKVGKSPVTFAGSRSLADIALFEPSTGIRFDFCSDDISTHSFRKGGATYVVGITGGPDSDAVKLRMEHTLGGCDDIYIRREAGADKYVERALAGLDANSLRFSALPPHFISIPENIEDVIPVCTVKNAANSLKSAFPFLIASVLYHWEWLVNNSSVVPLSKQSRPAEVGTSYNRFEWGDFPEDFKIPSLASSQM